ncbi:glycoside hydrolase [Mycobacterium mantenii]|uniref:Glycoside hydrolase n=1 Tax=Mycobacterium mantenii TaxID=560555 RepID=A0A1A2T2W9_MYCNT|nr:glycoside hydrolase [Mycobacterium mantenii]OBH43880.1 glycoside hydrolase [Mycobacterium mantenii]OBH70803.1 glycoside hydrolase [Mycobacterium mantenii]
MAPRVPDDIKLLVVSAKVFAKGRGRWLAIAASLIVSAAMIHAQGTKTRCCVEAPAASPTTTSSAVAARPPASAPRTATPAEVEALTALAPPAASAGQQFQLALPRGVGSEDRLQVKTIWAARAIGVLFPQIKTIYGYRQDPLPWHPNGLAIDVMIPNYHSPEGIELGNQIAGYALANTKRWGINHVIWRQKIYPGVGGGNWMADLGSETADHYDHVHIATGGGGYPTGHETYYIASMSPTPSG